MTLFILFSTEHSTGTHRDRQRPHSDVMTAAATDESRFALVYLSGDPSLTPADDEFKCVFRSRNTLRGGRDEVYTSREDFKAGLRVIC